jgi:uncharacterized Ntn-hydrolase superfamily protein
VTFSVVAHDPGGPAWGVAVASKALCVGAHVPWGRFASGALATQAWHDLRYGWEGLGRLDEGLAAGEVVGALTATDPEARYRQLGVVDRDGRAATHTGADCMRWAGGSAGDGFAVQGNLLAGPQVVESMAEAWRSGAGLPFAERLVEALAAGDAAGGDRRGRQSAALRVWGPTPLDLRVDDGPDPVTGLRSLVSRFRTIP